MRFDNLVIYILILFTCSCVAQKNIGESIEDWEDIEIEGLELPIHKMDGIKNFLWATDYGDGNLFKSTDGGLRWTKVYQFEAEYIERIQFVNEQVGFVCGDYGYVYKTEDGGLTWAEISPEIENRLIERYRNDTTKNQEPNGIFAAYYGMYFKNVNEGFVSGYRYNPEEGFRSTFKRILYYTEDGGGTWKPISKEEKEGFMNGFIQDVKPHYKKINGVYYFDENNSATTDENDKEEDIFLKKTGVESVEMTSVLPENAFERVMIRNIVFLNNEKGFLFGGSLDEGKEQSIIYETKDGGKTWEYVEKELPHIHESKLIEDYLWITGKEGLVKRKKVTRWTKKRR